MSKVFVRVVGGKCSRGYHKVGDTFEIEGNDVATPQGICLGAFGSIFPYIMVLLCDGEFFWSKTEKTRIHCPDPEGIILEIEKSETS